ncbi:spermatogenesis-associated protein 22 isoform X2 [Hyperolius riggenbachi]|uniref:spermatogenesis-associated protein 22 isoform X2 n=1 Tax=Hyperolius riggenbachi TaxID=752182 RepID=UPI0035A2A62D
MKRTYPAYLPVPIFNQKKINRQPLTSAPQTEEGAGFVSQKYTFSPISTRNSDSMWTSGSPAITNFTRKPDCSPQVAPSTPWPYASSAQQLEPNTAGKSTDKKNRVRFGDTNVLHSYAENSSSTSYYSPMQKSGNVKGQAVHQIYSPQVHSSQHPTKQTPGSSNRWYTVAAPSGSKTATTPYAYKTAKMSKDDAFADMPEEELVQAVSRSQVKVKETLKKRKTLRIITASIESMKHWSQHSDKVPLLFELIATLDSAVCTGSHGSKVFILRDGKIQVECVFYEIDRDLPRLIRGRLHRVMGNYDKKKDQLKCYSVRPASPAEQQTFMDLVRASSHELEQYLKTMNEI